MAAFVSSEMSARLGIASRMPADTVVASEESVMFPRILKYL
jgi:hypothetical protein